MVRTVLLLSVAALVSAGSPARADDGGPPGVVLERAASDPLPHWEVHLGGGVGAARVAMLGRDHGAVALSLDLAALPWRAPHTGLGLYLGEIVAAPWATVEMDAHPVVRELPFIVEPEVVHRSVHRHSRWLATGWTASLAAGAVVTRTSENWGHLYSHHSYQKTLEHGVEAGSTVQVRAFVRAGPLAVGVRPLASPQPDVDRALGLEAADGASW